MLLLFHFASLSVLEKTIFSTLLILSATTGAILALRVAATKQSHEMNVNQNQDEARKNKMSGMGYARPLRPEASGLCVNFAFFAVNCWDKKG